MLTHECRSEACGPKLERRQALTEPAGRTSAGRKSGCGAGPAERKNHEIVLDFDDIVTV